VSGSYLGADRAGTRAGAPEIVVATDHVTAVLASLEGMAVATDADRRLGLTKVALLASGAELERSFTPELEERRLPGDSRALRASDPVEKVLTGLRVRYATRYDGWFPVMGKNRDVVAGEGSPYMVIRSDDFPAPADAPTGVAGDGGRGITIGLVDTPVLEQDAFALQLEPVSTRLSAGPPWHYRTGHATFLAGLVAQHAPFARLLVRGVLDDDGARAPAWDVAVGILDLVDAGADVVALPIGCFTEDGQPPLVLRTAVAMARARALLVAASGNHGSVEGPGTVHRTSPSWPAALDGVVAVGARGRDDALAPFTPRSPWLALTAPGERLTSTFFRGPVTFDGDEAPTMFDGYATWSGSSMSAAIAAGHLASAAAERLRFLGGSDAASRRLAIRLALRDVVRSTDGVVRRAPGFLPSAPDAAASTLAGPMPLRDGSEGRFELALADVHADR
jgi:subtilisin family serine protease